VFDFVPDAPLESSTAVYLKHSTFRASFANGLPARDMRILAASQRPATLGALSEPSGAPAWRTIPSWYLIGTQDRIIPPAAERAMAERAGSNISYFDAGHLGLISDPESVTRVILRACEAVEVLLGAGRADGGVARRLTVGMTHHLSWPRMSQIEIRGGLVHIAMRWLSAGPSTTAERLLTS
jgi:hypothetical protein